MHIFLTLVLAGLGVALAAMPTPPMPKPGDWLHQDTDRVQGTLGATGAAVQHVEVDNVWGSIEVAAHDGPGVSFSATSTIRARTIAALEAARTEVSVDATENGPTVRLYVDGPFRDCGRAGRSGCVDPGYTVQYDFVVSVPRAARVTLRTVNDGHITVAGVAGGYGVHNVNGGVDMFDVAGGGEVSTVNGDIDIVYADNPRAPSAFTSVNGSVTALFRPALAADLRLQSMNGDFFTDFETGPLPARPVMKERRGSGFVYKTDRSLGVRVGAGGPELRFETLNGDIHILDRGTR